MKRPNILVILNDDMGYSDLGCYGGEVQTPNLDRLTTNGLQFTRFYNTPRCSPSRASLLTGLYPHQCDIGILTGENFKGDYKGNLNRHCVTMAEVLGAAGYRCYMSGKWHLTDSMYEPNGAWPNQRGFHRSFATICGGGSYYWPKTRARDDVPIPNEEPPEDGFYTTDAFSDQAAQYIREHAERRPEQPFFQYVAYTAPHWPLHAKEDDIAKYKGRFDAGWDQLREERLQRMIEKGLIDPAWKMTSRDPAVPAWDAEPEEQMAWQCRRMEVYAAQIDCMDQGIGRIVQALEDTGQLENTLIVFMADNGGCSEEFARVVNWDGFEAFRETQPDGRRVQAGNNPDLMPGPQDTYQSYGVPWANVSNTPFRLYKHWAHEGGISTPFIAHWPAGIKAEGELRHQYGFLPDVMATVLDITGVEYPSTFAGHDIPPCEGASLMPAFEGKELPERMMFWEHEGNAAVRDGKWKLVKNFYACETGKLDWGDERGDWELYDTDADRTELRNIASHHPDRVQTMKKAWDAWAERVGVILRDKWIEDKVKANFKY